MKEVDGKGWKDEDFLPDGHKYLSRLRREYPLASHTSTNRRYVVPNAIFKRVPIVKANSKAVCRVHLLNDDETIKHIIVDGKHRYTISLKEEQGRSAVAVLSAFDPAHRVGSLTDTILFGSQP